MMSKAYIAAFVFCAMLLMLFCGCHKQTAISMEVIGPEKSTVEDFKYENYTVLIKYSDGMTKSIVLQEHMVDKTDRQMLTLYKTHTLTVFYNNLVCSFTVELVPSKQEPTEPEEQEPTEPEEQEPTEPEEQEPIEPEEQEPTEPEEQEPTEPEEQEPTEPEENDPTQPEYLNIIDSYIGQSASFDYDFTNNGDKSLKIEGNAKELDIFYLDFYQMQGYKVSNKSLMLDAYFINAYPLVNVEFTFENNLKAYAALNFLENDKWLTCEIDLGELCNIYGYNDVYITNINLSINFNIGNFDTSVYSVVYLCNFMLL